jgi:hypothetical protein
MRTLFVVLFLLVLTACADKIQYRYRSRVKFHDEFYGNGIGVISGYEYRSTHLYYFLVTEGDLPNLWVPSPNIDGSVDEERK